jgi:hypothetical protein
MKTIKHTLLNLFMMVLSATAQLSLTYSSKIEPIRFINASNGREISLPQPGKLTLFHFAFAKLTDAKADDYLSSLKNISKELAIYRITINEIIESRHDAPQVLMPEHSEQLQPIWEIFLNTKENPILLIDKSCKVAFCGALESPESFNQILERLGVDLSLPQNVTLANILTEYETLVQFKTGDRINHQTFLHSNNTKIVFLYRSFCVPCGEDLLIKEILEYGKTARQRALDYVLIFRRLDAKANQQLDEILRSSDPSFMHMYEAQKREPVMERFFLNGNPVLLIFNNANKLIKARAINRLSPHTLVTFLNSIP